MKIFTIILLVVLTLAGCSNKEMYENIQRNRKGECQHEPPARYDECMAQYEESYESYEKSREELLKDTEKASR